MIVLEIILLLYFVFVSGYAFVLALAGLFFRDVKSIASGKFRKFAVLIPSYKEDAVIVGVAEQAIKQNYPTSAFDIVVIADSLREETLAKLRALPVRLIPVSFDVSTKVKSLTAAMKQIGDNYDFAVILDADNVMEKDFLQKINTMLDSGCRAIQAQRTSKNQTTSISVLDGLSERINNYIYRQGSIVAGFSCSLIGSGMIFEYAVVKEILSKLNSVGGFDRELELALIRRGIRIFYARHALVYDEKVESTEVFEKQRTRWLSSQFIYLRKYAGEGWMSLFKGNLSFFNSAILKNIQLPRLINLGLLFVLSVITFIFKDRLNFSYYPWLTFLGLNIVAIALAIPLKMYNWQMARSVFLLPGIFIKMFKLLFKLKGANKSFIHTPHGVTQVQTEEKK
jgi:cellulose synthase/poly-beta-1,6-N-acetylglucosamine synthase-like glycosyltransferase